MPPRAPDDVPASARRRVTRRLLPFLILVYLLAYLDRANLSIAMLQMRGGLGFTDRVIGLGAGIFFFGYTLLEVPGALLVERWSARKWLSRIMISWGLIASLTGFIGLPALAFFSTRTQFFLARFLLGAAEAGFFPGVIVYLSHWFRLEDRPRAQAWFMLTQPAAVIFGYPASRWILENIRWAGLEGWRWVFLLEGAPCILLGFVTLLYLTDRPAQARWLPEPEKSWLTAELSRERALHFAAGRVRIASAFRDPRTVLLTAVYFLTVAGNQALLFFLPSITDAMTRLSVPARTAASVAPYLCSAAGIVLNGFHSQRTGERRRHTALPMIFTGASFLLVLLAGDRLAYSIPLLCLAGFTSQAYLPVFWSLPGAFLGASAAAAAIGSINALGNLGGFAGPALFGALTTATGDFRAGIVLLAACSLAAGLLALRIRLDR